VSYIGLVQHISYLDLTLDCTDHVEDFILSFLWVSVNHSYFSDTIITMILPISVVIDLKLVFKVFHTGLLNCYSAVR
jgi:hypothetical protein